MYFTVYKITNLINGKIYVGVHKTDNLEDDYMGSGVYIKRAIEKHGVENFKKEYLFVYDNADDMYNAETVIVNEQFVESHETYNLKTGGYGGAVNMKDTDYYKSGQHEKNYTSARKKASQAHRDAKTRRIEDYNKNPKLCACCQSPIDYMRRKNKYCSKSCSAKVNNKGVNRHKK